MILISAALLSTTLDYLHLPQELGAAIKAMHLGSVGLITPPLGINLFILQGMSGRSLWQVARSCGPFFLLFCLSVLLLVIFPGIALWLPDLLYGKP